MTLAKQRNYELVLPTHYVDVDQDEMEYVDGGGKIGFRVHLPKWVIDSGAAVGGAAVTGVVVANTWQLALGGPIGAGIAAGLSTLAGALAAIAISNMWDHVDVVMDLWGQSENIKDIWM